MDKLVGKIMVLRLICENKSILFGPFSEEITMRRKVDIWSQVLNKAKSLGLVSYDKDYKYMRDIYWQNLKRGAVGKREKCAKDKDKTYSPIDDLVFEILERSNNPVPPLPKTVETKKEDSLDSTTLDSNKQEDDNNPNIVYIETAETNSPVSKKRSKNAKTKHLNEEKLRKRKMALQVENMEMQNYKLKLEILEMEQKLGLKSSKYTKEIAKKMSGDNHANCTFLKEDDTDEESNSDDNA